MSRTLGAVLALTLSISLSIASYAATAAPSAAGSVPAATTPPAAGWQPRPEEWPGTTVVKDLAIPMSDGVVLRGDLVLPADAKGVAAPGRFPVIVTITAYNKSAPADPTEGGDAAYLVRRGYAQLTVDARGTGSSAGQWSAFGAREHRDASEIVAWATSPDRPWSDGSAGMRGASYLGISQVYAASGQPPGLKAIFPQVPTADVYRDVVASGGQIDVGFMPLWLGLVTVPGLVPPAYGLTEPRSALATLVDHLVTTGTFTAPLLAGAMLGQDPAFDGPFYAERSPINVIDRVKVPTFLIAGEHDIFQRGTPLLFERLRQRGVPVKMVVGPWNHLQASAGTGLADAGLGTLEELQLRWFDHYVKGLADARLDADIPPLTYYEQGSGTWLERRDWMQEQRAQTWRLSGDAAHGSPGLLTTGTAEKGRASIAPVPVAGVCTRSTSQWTAGVGELVWPSNPCLSDNRHNDHAGVVYETEPLRSTLHLRGPINVRLHVSSPSGDGMLSVAVEDVAPGGRVSRLTGGWQVISHRALDEDRTRKLDGRIIQPYHPFTRAAKVPLAPGEIAPVDVEVFPTAAAIARGHRLRVAVQMFDTPHLMSPLTDAATTIAPLTIHTGAARPSVVTLPAWGPEAVAGATSARRRTTTALRLRWGRTPVGVGNRAIVRVRTADDRDLVRRGRVRIHRDGELVRTVRIRHGRAVVRLAGLRRPGRHLVTARFVRTAELRSSRAASTWRVTRRR